MAIHFLDKTRVPSFLKEVNSDPEFQLAARLMSANILLGVGNSSCMVKMHEGKLTELNMNVNSYNEWDFSIKGPLESWEKLLQPVPPPFYNNLFAGTVRKNFEVSGNLETAFAHYWAVSRLLDVMRQFQNK
jgi:hypothetical protein